MIGSLFGVPFYILGVVCLGVSGVYALIWPRPRRRAARRPPGRQFILRWFHSLIWVLLALFCFTWGFLPLEIGAILASLALVLYLAFLGAALIDRG